MSKRAEEAAIKVAVKKYPHGMFDGEIGDSLRAACAVGYMQAVQDIALTWENVEKLVDLYEDVYCDFSCDGRGGYTNTKEHYEEVLRRFNEQRKK